jgi:DNA-binding NarL/FixJ family response regulator
MIRILIVVQNPAIRERLAEIVKNAPDRSLITEAQRAEAA